MVKQKKEQTKKVSARKNNKKLWLKLAVFSTAGLLVSFLLLFTLKTRLGVKLAYQQENQPIDTAFVLKLNQDVAELRPHSIEPSIEGNWQYKKGLFGVNRLEFTPHDDFIAGQEYTIKFHEAKRTLLGKLRVDDVTFKVETAPGLKDFSATQANSKTVAAESSFTATFNSKVKNLRKLELTSKPKITFEHSDNEDSFSWKPIGLLPQSKVVELTLKDVKNNQVLETEKFKIADQPAVANSTTTDHFARDQQAEIIFKEDIDQSSTNLIKFSVEGQGSWKDGKTYTFKPGSVQPGKTYSYTVKKGLKTKSGGVLTKDLGYKFSTPGAIHAIAASPWGYELSQASQDIRFTFDQPVDQASAQKRFGISSGKVRSFRWEGNTMVVNVVNLGFQNSVTAFVEPGIQPIFGLPSNVRQTVSFTTEVPTRKLNVPFYYQAYAQSCEAASARMALAYRGINSSDWAILQTFGYHPRHRDKARNIWDDPQQQFVGDVNGSQGAGTGWGVYANPVANGISSMGRSASAHYGVGAGFIADQIHRGNPVIFWGIWGGSAKLDSWKTPAGKTIQGPNPMHVRLVVGVKGKASAPMGFYIHDPITGPAYWTVDQLNYNLNYFGVTNQVVVVH